MSFKLLICCFQLKSNRFTLTKDKEPIIYELWHNSQPRSTQEIVPVIQLLLLMKGVLPEGLLFASKWQLKQVKFSVMRNSINATWRPCTPAKLIPVLLQSTVLEMVTQILISKWQSFMFNNIFHSQITETDVRSPRAMAKKEFLGCFTVQNLFLL